MSANGARASSVASNSENSLVGASGYKFKKDGKKSTKLKLKKLPAPAMKRQDSDMTGSKDDGASSRSSSPILPEFGEEVVIDGNDTLETVICKHCKKPVLKRTAKEHMVGCLKSKQDKARKKKEARDKAQRAKAKAEGADEDDDEDDDIKGSARKGASQGDGADDGTKKGKKRKAEEEADSATKKKKSKKEEQKPKVAKPKGPVDVEKQCGVQLPNGGQCARSLTCKSHSMGAKRAVPGRSLPYDMLLQAYQKKNQARQQSKSNQSSNVSKQMLMCLYRGCYRCQCSVTVRRRRSRSNISRTNRFRRRTRRRNVRRVSRICKSTTAGTSNIIPNTAEVSTGEDEGDAVECAWWQ